MKVLWLCNVMMPMIAEQLNMETTNKEGWISGLADVVLKKRYETELSWRWPFLLPKRCFRKDMKYVCAPLPFRAAGWCAMAFGRM